MVFPLDTDTEADLDSGLYASCDLVDFYVKDGVGDPAFLRAWSWPGECEYAANDPSEIAGAVGATDVTYESMYDRMLIPKGVRLSASLSSDPLNISLDGSRSDDDEDWVGRFVDSDWHQCRMRVRSVLMRRDTGAMRTQPHWEWHGRLNHRNLKRQEGQLLIWEVECQGGLFRIRGRRLRTRSHEDQQKRSAGDLFYEGTPLMVGMPLIWNKSNAQIPAVTTNNGRPGGFVYTGRVVTDLLANLKKDTD